MIPADAELEERIDAAARLGSKPAEPDDAIALLRELIRTACVNDGTDGSGQEIRAVRVLQAYFGELSVEMEVIEPAPGRGNLIATLRGTNPGAPRLALVGHLDVVPADAAGWRYDPFAAHLIDGEIWGRGAVDMLNFTAAMAVAFKMAAESDVRLTGDLVFAATADEEAGSRYGMGWLVQHRPELVLTDYALTESGGGITVGDDQRRRVTITTGQKGAAGRRIRLRGSSGHGSMPYGLTGGVHLAAEAIGRITKHRTRPVVPAEPWWRDLVTALGFDQDLVSRLLDPATLDDALPETGELARVLHALTHLTISPNVVMSGTKANVIPGEAVIDLDIRLLPGQTAEDAERELTEILSGLPGDVLIEPGYEALAVQTGQDDELYRVLCKVIDEFLPGAEPLPMLTPGGNDARHYLVRGLPCYGFGMFSPEMDIASFRARFHGDNERIDVASVRLAAAAYLRITHRLLACN